MTAIAPDGFHSGPIFTNSSGNAARLRAVLRRGLAGFLLLITAFLASGHAQAQSFEETAGKLGSKSFSEVAAAIEALAATGDDRALPILNALQDGTLSLARAGDKLVIATPTPDGFALQDALTGAALDPVGRRDVRKIAINNMIRTALRSALGSLQLFADEASVRLTAATSLLSNPSPDALPILDKALLAEKDGDVREMLDLARAAIIAQSDASLGLRLAAVERMSGSMISDVWQVLGRLQGRTATPDDQEIAKAATEALETIELAKRVYSLAETIYFGISLGAVLMLTAVGLAITFGVMGVINMAHGEMLMLGAYTTFVVQQLMPNAIEYSLFVAVPLAFLVAGAVGVVIERTVIRVLYGRPLETLLATFGISLILQQAVRSIFSPLNQPVTTPQWMSGFYEVNGALSLTYNRLYIILFCAMVFFALLLLLKKTSFGLQMRAVTQNRAMASSMGIRTGWVDALTFGLGSGIAGVAGVALSQLTNVGPNLGQAYIIDSFMVVVFGGVGNLWGTFVGALTLGVANKFLEPFTGAVFAKILVLVFIIIFIQRRPSGLFALKGRAVEH